MENKSKKILSEISAGELLDKISILEIKLEKIKNHYQGEVNHPFIDKQQFFYNLGPSGMIEQS